MVESHSDAPGRPGIPPRWTSSAKAGVGTALSPVSRVWFTLSHGILNEIYYPRVDQACVRDLGLIVTDGRDFFSEEKRHTTHQVAYLAEGIPAYRLVNTCQQGRYRLEKKVLTDPQRDVLLQQIRFIPLLGALADYGLFVLLAPHLGNRGSNNTAWIGHYKGVSMLFGQRAADALALACSAPWLKCSAGFVGVSDGWQDLARHKEMTWTYARAEGGNVALTGQVDLETCGGTFVLALGFGRNPAEAGHRALASLLDGFEASREEYVRQWQAWQDMLHPLTEEEPVKRDLYRLSTAVVRTHEAKRFPGGIIASLSVPWGSARRDEDTLAERSAGLGGYHVVWPRDLVEAAGGLLAAGTRGDACRVLCYLQATQEADGHWPQNMWLDGQLYWEGVQMDETAFPILLVDLARHEGALDSGDLDRFWPMVRRAAAFLVRNGPVTPKDRWEEDPGYSPFTLAVEIAALLVAADLADLNGETVAAAYLRETADVWNANVERWTYVTGTDLARQEGVEGYYVRIAPPEVAEAALPAVGFVPIKNRPPGQNTAPADHLVSPDTLALVRFGLRAPDDPRIVGTVKVVDALLKVETPCGPAWHRYNGDGYGEHEDGSPFDGIGMGRAWPLLTGQRAHYELAAGRREEATRLLRALEAFAGEGGMLPEQVWDAPDVPEHELFFGRPTGSAMPLVWAHAEYLKLRRSLHDGQMFDTPPQPVQRYQVDRIGSPHAIWRFNHKLRTMPAGKTLRVETSASARVHWSADGRQAAHSVETHDTGLGMHIADLPTRELPAGTTLALTFYWPEADQWEGVDFTVKISTACL
jgi:glucoamylase